MLQLFSVCLFQTVYNMTEASVQRQQWMLVAKNVLLPHGKPRVKASHENPFAMGWIPFHGPCYRCSCMVSHRQDHYGRSDSITGLSCICQKVQALNFFNLKMKTPSSINGKLFKPTSVTCWDSSQLQELQKKWNFHFYSPQLWRSALQAPSIWETMASAATLEAKLTAETLPTKGSKAASEA